MQFMVKPGGNLKITEDAVSIPGEQLTYSGLVVHDRFVFVARFVIVSYVFVGIVTLVNENEKNLAADAEQIHRITQVSSNYQLF